MNKERMGAGRDAVRPAMEEDLIRRAAELLDTADQALDELTQGENGELRELLLLCRQTLTESLGEALGCSLEHRIEVDSLSDREWVDTARHILGEIADPFPVRNSYDLEFQSLLRTVWNHSAEELASAMEKHFSVLREKAPEAAALLAEHFNIFGFWGSLRPEEGDFQTFSRRAHVLKRHSYDFLWLYRRLEDYVSRRTLTAILLNWLSMDLERLAQIRSTCPDYWDPDIFPDNRGDVMVDLGAFVGDSIGEYIKMYGRNYRRIIAYEISPSSCELIRKNLRGWNLRNLEIRQKGVGRERGSITMMENPDYPSGNRLDKTGTGNQVEVAALDEDLEEPPTLIKMDIEGGEWDALLGSQRILRENAPKLAVCVYHGYDDLWRLPGLIDRIQPDYRFYLRFYGGGLKELFPTEYVLQCIV